MVRRELKIVDCGLRIFRKFLFLLLIFASTAFSQEISISARTDSTNYRIGDWIQLRIEVRLPLTVETIGPVVKDSIGSFEILKAEASDIVSDGDKQSRTWIFTLTTFDSGKGYVPPVDFAYRLKGDTTQRLARSNSLTLDIGSVAIDPQGDIRDIKLPFDAPWKFEDYLLYLIALGAVLSAGFGYYYWRKKRKQKEGDLARIKPQIPPHLEALYALRELEDKKLWQQGKVKEYYSEVTEIIRRFFEGRWKVVALELTSDEILVQMKIISDAQKVWREMQSFFMTADLVKFAK